MAFTNFQVPNPAGGAAIPLTGSALNGTATIGGGTSVYEGTISGTVVANATSFGLTGGLNGGIFGVNGQATAGTFDTDATTPTGAEFVGNFAANQ